MSRSTGESNTEEEGKGGGGSIIIIHSFYVVLSLLSSRLTAHMLHVILNE